MGKRYKKGNCGRKKKKPATIYKNNERRLNKKIDEFRKIVLNADLTNEEVYKKSDKLRREIKNELRQQGRYLYTQSNKRRFIYYDQTAHFKGLYVTWKKITLPVYLSVRFNIPKHLVPALAVYYRDVKRGGNPSLRIF